MNTRCSFDQLHLSFSGSPLDQARCLLRFVKRGGDVGDTPATLPSILEQLLGAPQTLNLTVAQLRAYLQLHNIPENKAGGSLDAPLSRADTNNPAARLAQYFMIHDTSSKLSAGQTFDPNFINTAQWNGNRLFVQSPKKTHLYINRLGETLMENDYQIPFRATQFEVQPDKSIPGAGPKDTIFRGLCLHHELVQPRKGPRTSDIDSPDPGFTQAQYERLALQYLIASARRGSWMVPAFHCVLDLHIGDHDDPQNFDLSAWGKAIVDMLAAVRGAEGGQPQPPPPPATLKSRLLAADPILQEVAAGNRVLGFSEVKSLTGIGPLQDALNLMADNGQPSLNIPGARGPNSFRGFYGKQTIAAVSAFQVLKQITPVDGTTGRDTIVALDAAVVTAEGDGVPAVDTPVLKSDLLQDDNTLEAVADGHIVLHATEGKVDGIGPIQDALNRLGFPINLGNSNQFRGFFGEKTEAALMAFQQATPGILNATGFVDQETVKALDTALLNQGVELEPPVAPKAVKLLVKGKVVATLKEKPGGSGRFRSVDVMQLPGRAGFYYKAAMAIDVDGSPRAYTQNATSPKPLDSLTSVDSEGIETMYVQQRSKTVHGVTQVGEGPFKDFFVSRTSLLFKNDETFKTSNFVDAEQIPYIVFPHNQKEPEVFSEVSLGDMGYVIDLKTGRTTHAIFADTNPKVGEASLRVALNLGRSDLNAHNGEEADRFLYILFPGTRFDPEPTVPHWPDLKIKAEADKAFAAWGGMDQVRALFPIT